MKGSGSCSDCMGESTGFFHKLGLMWLLLLIFMGEGCGVFFPLYYIAFNFSPLSLSIPGNARTSPCCFLLGDHCHRGRNCFSFGSLQ